MLGREMEREEREMARLQLPQTHVPVGRIGAQGVRMDGCLREKVGGEEVERRRGLDSQ